SMSKALVGETAIMSEEQVREPGATYTPPTAAEADEHLMEQLQVQFPPYFERFLEERDRRIASELGRLEAAVEHNGAEIARVLREMDRRFAEAQEERERRFAEAREERETLRAEMRSQFRWTIGLLFPLVVGVIAMIVRVFLVGTF
ncbi:unnamed protein product, partial [marine sediment metagenome]